MDAGENRLISSFKSFCSFKNFFISSTSLQTGSGTVSFLQALGPVFFALSDLIPPNVTESSLGGVVVAVVAGAAVEPKRLGAAAVLPAVLVFPNKLVPELPSVRAELPAAAVVPPRDVFPNSEVVLVVVVGFDADKFPNNPMQTGILNKH